jgi:hypothetical protein
MEEKKRKKLNLERLNLQPQSITVPPPKETFKACGKLVRAACVVLTFVLLLFSFPYSQPSGKKARKQRQLLLIYV